MYRCFNRYLCSEGNPLNGMLKKVVANREAAKKWETWDYYHIVDNIYALKAYNGKYMSVSKDGLSVKANSSSIGQYEKFEIVPFN